MKAGMTIKGRFFVARSHPQHPNVWAVYDLHEKQVESFGGDEAAARARIAALDHKHTAQHVAA